MIIYEIIEIKNVQDFEAAVNLKEAGWNLIHVGFNNTLIFEKKCDSAPDGSIEGCATKQARDAIAKAKENSEF